MDKGLIIIPVYNEEKNIEDVLDEIKKNLNFCDILIIDDCSTDGTVRKIRNIKEKYLSLPFNMGYSSALQTGFKYAVDNNYDYIVQYDGDGQHIAKEALKLYQLFKDKEADIVIGSRFKSKIGYSQPLFRRLGSKIFRLFIKNICGVDITDPTSGFQIIKREVFKRYARMYNFPRYPDANLIIEMLLNNYKIYEVAVEMRKRKSGKSMHRGIIHPIKYMIGIFYSIFLIVINYKVTYLFKKRRKK